MHIYVYIYIYLYNFIDTYIATFLFVWRSPKEAVAHRSAASCLQRRERAEPSPEFMQDSYKARNTLQEPHPCADPHQKLHPLTALAAHNLNFADF